MISRERSCQGCGQRPCYGCTELKLVCDSCEVETDELYVIDSEQYCRKCAIETLLDSVTVIDERNAADYE